MAKVQYSALVSEMRGKFNGSQLSKNRSGNILQVKCSQRIGATPSQSLQRSTFGFLARYWRSLSPADQTDNSANSVNYPYTDKFGNTRYFTGYQLLLRSNLNLAVSALPPIAVVPATPPVAPTMTLDDFFAYIEPSPVGSLFWAWDVTSASQDDYTFQFFVSQPYSAGVQVYTGKWLNVGFSDPSANEFGLAPEAIPFYSTWQIGQKVSGKLFVVHKASGVEVLSFLSDFILTS